ncbi:MAG: hypothetical protein H6742_14365 [Alphaproteobacteria bacterium]|nr:hypothetical protein [Alphaproteobacteria bacterium]
MPRLLVLARPDHHEFPGLRDALGAWVLAGATISALPPSGEDASERLRRILAKACPDVVVAVGGDGTVHLVANALRAADCLERAVVAVVPAGTGNDLASQLDPAVPMRPRALARVTAWLAGRGPGPTCTVRSIDLMEVTVDPPAPSSPIAVANVLSIGPSAALTASTPRGLKEGLGGLAYLLHGLANLSEVQPFACEVRAAGLRFEGPALGVFVANGSRAGGGMTIASDAALDTGCARVVVVPDMPLPELARALGHGLGGAPEEHPRILAADFDALRILVPDGTTASLDGEAHALTAAQVTVRPGCLRLLAPAPDGPRTPPDPH